MTNPTVDKLLPQVRRWVLEFRAASEREREGFGLSYIVEKLTPQRLHDEVRRKFSREITRVPGIYRGRVQQCLTFLAHEGIMYTRQHAEGGVQSYNHGETDKRYRVRITQAEAIRRLKKMS